MIKYKTPFKLKPLEEGNILGYQVPIGTVAHSRACTAHNPTEVAITLEIHVLPDNIDTPSIASRIIKKNLAAGESYLCPELANHNLQTGDKVYFVGKGINLMFSVMEQNA
jgi:hypothetical protein